MFSFNILCKSILEGLHFQKPKFKQTLVDRNGKKIDAGRSQALLRPQETGEITDLKTLKYRMDDLFRKYGFRFNNIMQLADKFDAVHTNVLFRGHKTLNPFIKTFDTKSPRDTVYWAKQPDNAMTFLKVSATGGTSGRHAKNILHDIYGIYNSGYFSIAYPKYPDALKWYEDFGVENEIRDNIQHRKIHGTGIDYDKHVPDHKFPSYRMNDGTGFKRAETALGPQEVTKLKTFVLLIDAVNPDVVTLLNVEKIKKIDPVVYKILMWGKL